MNGNYEVLQCDKERCWCMDPDTGQRLEINHEQFYYYRLMNNIIDRQLDVVFSRFRGFLFTITLSRSPNEFRAGSVELQNREIACGTSFLSNIVN